MTTTQTLWPSLLSLNLSSHQKEVGGQSLTGPICILGGSPGTGKTWMVSEIVLAVEQTVGLDNVLVGSPTGKAAVRVTENLQAKSIDLRARTWHSLIMQLDSQKESYFRQKILIGDESSMLDTDLFAAIMRRIARGSLFLIVGDVNQLPPVGHGAPMRDLIAAGLPYGELTEIVRNSGGIVETCAAIRDQRGWEPADNLLLVDDGSVDKAEAIKSIYRSAREEGLDLINDVQVVCAVNEKSPLSRQALNKQLQAILNSQPGEVSRAGFRAGDKVVCTKNGFYKEAVVASPFHSSSLDDTAKNDRDEVYVANGELGRVVSCDDRGMTVQLEAPARTIQVYFSQEGGSTFELGYALSVHKSQGSDWPWVIVMLDEYPGARMVCDRSWLYTAISRAKLKCWLVGKRQTAMRMCKTSKIWHRKTFLKERILMEKSKRRLADV